MPANRHTNRLIDKNTNRLINKSISRLPIELSIETPTELPKIGEKFYVLKLLSTINCCE